MHFFISIKQFQLLSSNFHGDWIWFGRIFNACYRSLDKSIHSSTIAFTMSDKTIQSQMQHFFHLSHTSASGFWSFLCFE
jgi:hypothetical protein